MRILFVGQAPSKATDGKPAFTGICGRRLASLMGLTQERMLLDHDFVNVLDRYPGTGGSSHPRGDAWPLSEARKAASLLWPTFAGRKVVLVGKNVRDAFKRTDEFFVWSDAIHSLASRHVLTDKAWIVVVPHPSGVSHWWNDSTNLLAAKFFFRSLIRYKNVVRSNKTRRQTCKTKNVA